MNKLSNKTLSFIFGIIAFVCTSYVNADTTSAPAPAPTDPTAAVARLSYFSGPVTFQASGTTTWVNAQLNRPLVTGDQLWSDAGGQAELQLDNAALRISAQTYLNILSLQDGAAQFQLSQGTLNFHVWTMSASQKYEIDTPNLAFDITQPGDYRIDVDPKNDATIVSINQGQGTVYGKTASNQISTSESCTYHGTDLNNSQCGNLPPQDAFDQWCLSRDKMIDNSISSQYVSPALICAADLGYYGTWTNLQGIGNAWTPNNVAANWAPYTQGQWVSIAPWGWTWVDNEPWGFAPFHYGRWTQVNNLWYWIPGPASANPVYAPALVAFVGGNNELQVNNSPSVAWFPLGPGDVYVPPYPVSAPYFTGINASNAVISNANILAVYNNPGMTINYHNYGFANAITLVPRSVFIASGPIFNVRIRVTNVNIFYHLRIGPIIHFGPAPVYRPVLFRPPMRVLTPPPVTRMRPLRPAMAPITPPHTRPWAPITPPHTRPLGPITPPNPMQPITPPHTRPLGPVTPHPMAPITPPHTRPLGPVTPHPMAPITPPHTQPMAPIKPADKPMAPITPAHRTAPMKPVTPAYHRPVATHPAHRQQPASRGRRGGGGGKNQDENWRRRK